jgi:hypothetical protein
MDQAGTNVTLHKSLRILVLLYISQNSIHITDNLVRIRAE